jgi:AcrR family transcriptional regulator
VPVPVSVVLGRGEAASPRRADAVRNQALVLAAAERLFARDGVDKVTMPAIAKEAGVGVGTLYRGFTDKAGLAMALLDEREREFQALMLSGPPPLGPGAGPVERLAAFVAGYVGLVADQVELVIMSQTAAPGARFRSGAHALWRTHCRTLLAQAGAPAAEVRTESLLAALSGEMIAHWLTTEGRNLATITTDLTSLARALAQPDGNAP